MSFKKEEKSPVHPVENRKKENIPIFMTGGLHDTVTSLRNISFDS
jgi:hypothetical protein